MINNSSLKNIIFVSHANPEGNEFAKWLTLRLIAEGYPVYCEILNLLGGEDPWKNIQQIIREKAIKFLFVASKASMQEKTGCRKELALAEQVANKEGFKEFIIPLSIENLPRDEYCIELQTTYPVSFEHGWAKGLNQLLEKLEQQNIAKNPDFNHNLVNSWWRNNYSANKGLENKPEELLSSWYEIDKIPEKLYYHHLRPNAILTFPPDTKGYFYPYKKYGKGIISFTDDPTDFPEGELIFGDKFPFKINSLLQNNHSNNFLTDRETRDIITDLLRQAWENLFTDRGLESFTLANKSKFCFFKKDQIPNDKIYFLNADSRRTWRSVIGYKSIGTNKRYWHFGVSAKPLFWRNIFFSISPHVLFSNDGEIMWDDPDKIHKAKIFRAS